MLQLSTAFNLHNKAYMLDAPARNAWRQHFPLGAPQTAQWTEYNAELNLSSLAGSCFILNTSSLSGISCPMAFLDCLLRINCSTSAVSSYTALRWFRQRLWRLTGCSELRRASSARSLSFRRPYSRRLRAWVYCHYSTARCGLSRGTTTRCGPSRGTTRPGWSSGRGGRCG